MSTVTTSTSKPADSSAPLHPLLAHRWSPRAFDPGHQLSDAQLEVLLEAARWAPSSSNLQPWRFAVAPRGTAAHGALVDTLARGNRAWAPSASALIVAAAVTTGPEGEARPWARYDTGQAVGHLTVQAQHEGLVMRQMGGFDAEAVAALIGEPGVAPIAILAIGRQAEADVLDDRLAGREAAPRARQPLEAMLLALDGTGWGAEGQSEA